MFLRELFSTDSDNNFTLDYHQTLNPKLWDDFHLNSKVEIALNKISKKFIEFLKIPPSSVVDVILTGSNCNYNWTQYSDIDLHIAIKDYDEECEDCFVIDPEECLNAKKSLWNEVHDISIKDINVELYAQFESDTITSDAGVYSLKYNKWIKKPTKENVKYDVKTIQNKTKKISSEIDDIINANNTNLNDINKLKERIRNMRKSGLEKHGEFSLENLVFKQLRNTNYLKKLSNYAKNLENKELSL